MVDETETNRVIHAFLGKCWHEWEVVDTPQPCLKCGETQNWRGRFIEAHPKYDADLNLIAEVEKKAIERFGKLRWFIFLSRATGARDADYETISDPMAAASATAFQRATAIKNLIRAQAELNGD